MENDHIQQFRLEAGLTLAELSRKSNVSVRTIQRMESGYDKHRETTKRKVYNALRQEPAIEGSLPPFDELFGGGE